MTVSIDVVDSLVRARYEVPILKDFESMSRYDANFGIAFDVKKYLESMQGIEKYIVDKYNEMLPLILAELSKVCDDINNLEMTPKKLRACMHNLPSVEYKDCLIMDEIRRSRRQR